MLSPFFQTKTTHQFPSKRQSSRASAAITVYVEDGNIFEAGGMNHTVPARCFAVVVARNHSVHLVAEHLCVGESFLDRLASNLHVARLRSAGSVKRSHSDPSHEDLLRSSHFPCKVGAFVKIS